MALELLNLAFRKISDDTEGDDESVPVAGEPEGDGEETEEDVEEELDEVGKGGDEEPPLE